MSYIKEKVAYLHGLADGLDIGADPQGKLITAIIAALDEIADAVDENEAAIMELDECLDDVCEELDTIDEYLFDDEDDDEDEDDDFMEVECPECGETVYFDTSMLESDDDLICPNCNASIVPGFEEEDDD